MIRIDLVTGFLGSGKTTFIQAYARYLIKKGERIAILENDYGAVNVDALLLDDLNGEKCEIETIAGGCDHACHVRRFRTKLIAMGMLGFDRVIVEPSGVYDVDEFFDVLHDDPIDQWYEIGNVIAIVDINLLKSGTEMSEEARYFLMSQAACAGILVPSHIQGEMQFSPEDLEAVMAFTNGIMEAFRCSRRFAEGDFLAKDWSRLTEEDFRRLSSCGFYSADHIRLPLADDNGFSSLYFLNLPLPLARTEKIAAQLFEDKTVGRILRIKGFHYEQGQWYELNASRSRITLEKCRTGQELFIVIGEGLNGEAIRNILGVADDVWHNGNVYDGSSS